MSPHRHDNGDRVRTMLVRADELVQQHLTLNVNAGMADLMRRRARRNKYARIWLIRALRNVYAVRLHRRARKHVQPPLVVVDQPNFIEIGTPPKELAGPPARFRRRAGLFGGALGGLAALALAASLTVTAFPGSGGTAKDLGGAAGTDPPVAGTDPLVTQASFGWLPSSVAGVGYQVGAHGDLAQASGTGMAGTRLLLSLYPAGTTPALGSFATGARQLSVPTEPVDGGTAYWMTADTTDPTNGGDTYLRWQTASGRWAEIHAYYLHDADPLGVLRHVAATVTTGGKAIPLPIRITGLPTDFRLDEAALDRPSVGGDAPWSLQIIYRAAGASVDIDVSPAGTADRHDGASCTTARGLDVCVRTPNGVPPSLTAIGGTNGMLQRITPLGTDEHDWTTDVVS